MTKVVTKTALAVELSEKLDISKAAAGNMIDALSQIIIEGLKNGDAVTLPGLGKIAPKHRDARSVRNPQTGEIMNKPADIAVRFVAGKSLKDALNA